MKRGRKPFSDDELARIAHRKQYQSEYYKRNRDLILKRAKELREQRKNAETANKRENEPEI